jgi:hypothetical protein
MSRKSKIVKTMVIIPMAAFTLLACMHMGMMKAAPRPAASEFGYGPRASGSGQYRVTVQETAPFKKGKILRTVIQVAGTDGKGVEGLQISVDGGMPQHGHGLPTKPRVTKDLGDGRYQVEGLKFNMGGWWELKFRMAGTPSDSVVFNLDLK